jgi:hypothetical protein
VADSRSPPGSVDDRPAMVDAELWNADWPKTMEKNPDRFTDTDEAPAGWNYEQFDHPNYYLMILGGRAVQKSDDVNREQLKEQVIREQGQEWWDRYGEQSLDAALYLFGEGTGDEASKHGDPDSDPFYLLKHPKDEPWVPLEDLDDLYDMTVEWVESLPEDPADK